MESPWLLEHITLFKTAGFAGVAGLEAAGWRAETRRLAAREGALSFPLKGAHAQRSIRDRATGIEMPDAVLVIEPCGIAHRRCISVRRIDADADSKSRAISPSAVISATTVIGTTIGMPAIEVSTDVPTWCREGTPTTKVAAARCSVGVSSTKSSHMAAAESATAIRCHYR